MFNGSKLQKFALLLALIFVASAVIAGIVYVVQYGNTGFSFSNYSPIDSKGLGKSTDVDEERTEALQGVNSIYIEDISEDINLIPVEGNDVKVHFYGSYSTSNPDCKPELTVEKTGSSLRIIVKHKTNIRLIQYTANLKLDVYLPKQFAGKLEAKSTSGSLIADELNLEVFEYKNVSGNLNVTRLNAQEAVLNTTSGEVKIEGLFDRFSFTTVSGDFRSANFVSKDSKFGTTSGKIEASGNPGDVNSNTVSGSLFLEYSSFSGKIEADTTSGDIEIRLPNDSGFGLDFTTVSGYAECDFPITVSGTKSGKNLKGTVGNGDGTINVSTVSGNLEILK